MIPASRSLRVTHVITAINAGGAELALVRLVEATADCCEHHIIVISEWDPLRERFEATGAAVTTIGLGRRNPNPVKVARIATAIRRSRPDVVQTWLPAGDLLGGVLARLVTRSPVVWNLRNSELDPARSRRLTRAITRTNGVLSRLVPSRIVAVGERAADVHAALRFDRSRMHVIRNGFVVPPLGGRDAARSQLGIPTHGPMASRLGRFHSDKDHQSLLDAWSRVTTRIPAARLLLAGEDMNAHNEALTAMIRRYGVEGSVTLLGRLDDPGPVYRASDIGISNSLAEGFPNVVGEAMAHATPVVVTDVGDSAMLVGDSGRVVPAADAPALADAITELLQLTPDARAELGRRGRERISERFSMPAMADRYVALWTEVADVRH